MLNFRVQKFSSPYINRDLSWLEFNRRVLEEAVDPLTPLFEKAKFLSIVSTNLDEFMSVRVAGLYDQVKAGYTKTDFTGYTPSGLIRRIMKRTARIVSEQYKSFRDLRRQLAREGIRLQTYAELSVSQKKAMDQYYHGVVYPVITPMAIDQARPFPMVNSLALYLSIVLVNADGEEKPNLAIVRVPPNLSRIIPVPCRPNSKKHDFILMEDLMKQHIHHLFEGYTIVGVHAFRLTRNSDLTLNEEGAEDLLEEIEKELRKRRWAAPIRLEVQKDIHPFALERLKDELEIEDHIFEIDGPLDLGFIMKWTSMFPARAALKYPELQPVYPHELDDAPSILDVLRERDVLLHHPYESFDAVNDFIQEAAADPQVLAIKITLYRVSGNSVLVRELAKAAEEGKQVTVVLELKARFDEERNIAWARQLEKAGCHVVYGLVGLKTHAKVTLVVRQEEEVVRRYVHVGTGNYNDNTAKMYTDVGLLTSDHAIGEDATMLFNEITGYSVSPQFKELIVAPNGMKERLLELIRREKQHALDGKPARIVAKMNSLSNQEMVDELYAASQAGVRIDLIVRGVCCLRPGVPGLSETITVRSIVDRYLEHSRLLYLENGGKREVWLCSNDWMTRNLSRRVEVMCPVKIKTLQDSVISILQMQLADNTKARILQPNGSYIRAQGAGGPVRSQFKAEDITYWKRQLHRSGV